MNGYDIQWNNSTDLNTSRFDDRRMSEVTNEEKRIKIRWVDKTKTHTEIIQVSKLEEIWYLYTINTMQEHL